MTQSSSGNSRKPREQHRYRLSVPDADQAVVTWIEAQENVSVSLRTVIRDYIARHGVDDPTCRPVEQLPRRGRPPGSGHQQQQLEDADRRGDVDLSGPERADRPEDDFAPIGMDISAAAGRLGQASPHQEPFSGSSSGSSSSLPTGQDGQVDINDLLRGNG